METRSFYEREQFIGRRRLEEKEAVLIAKAGLTQLQGLVQTGRLVCGEQGQQRGRCRQQHPEAAFPAWLRCLNQ